VHTFMTLSYMFAALLFILGVRRLRSPETARSGNSLAAIGMAIALGVTLLDQRIVSYWEILVGVAIGSVIGYVSAVRVPMTAMPQMVAAFNGVGGGAVAFIALAEFYQIHIGQVAGDRADVFFILAGILIGSVSFAGSAIAYVKLEELFLAGSVTFPYQKVANAGLLGAAVLLGINALAGGPLPLLSVWLVFLIALTLGVLLVIPIGGADMPIVISLLNAFTGLAAAMSGFLLSNEVLIIAGALVGASGTILTRLMSSSLGRPLNKIIFAGVGASPPAAAKKEEDEKPVNSVTPEDVAAVLNYDADSVIIVPGYGLAVAQAQTLAAELVEVLERKGKVVRFAIHPVAGRMPGHMNVLLAEADVPYDKLLDLEEINADFPETDAVIVVGANDVVNPAAKDPNLDSPISGMPVLDVESARRVIFIKRSLSPGFAGVDNPLFYQEKTMMLFADARQGLQDVIAALKESG
jgi:NAD(P) transhydrogenase subunit beta